MLRVFFTIVLPLVLPTALYLVWVRLAHWSSGGSSGGSSGESQEGSERSETVRWAALPWLWLAAAGAVLLALVLFVVTVHFGSSQPGIYVPPRSENGRIVPGHIEPAHNP